MGMSHGDLDLSIPVTVILIFSFQKTSPQKRMEGRSQGLQRKNRRERQEMDADLGRAAKRKLFNKNKKEETLTTVF